MQAAATDIQRQSRLYTDYCCLFWRVEQSPLLNQRLANTPPSVVLQMPFENFEEVPQMYDYIRQTWPYWNESVSAFVLPRDEDDRSLQVAAERRNGTCRLALPPCSTGEEAADAALHHAHLRPRPQVRRLAPQPLLRRHSSRFTLSSPLFLN